MATQSDVLWFPTTQEEKEEVQEQLQRLLTSPSFRNSQRYPALLRYAVEHTLAGFADQLKERTVGIVVFHRPADYDTNTDPVVRVTAGEVRKRLAVYYQEHPHELRIDLPAGSYVPQFRPVLPIALEYRANQDVMQEQLPQTAAFPDLEVPLLEQALEPAPGTAAVTAPQSWRQPALWIAGIVLALLAIAGTTMTIMQRENNPDHALKALWAPILTARKPPAFILGGRMAVYLGAPIDPFQESAGEASQPVSMIGRQRAYTISVGDALSFARVASFLSSRGVNYAASSAEQTTLEDLRAHPSVLFGALNNPWTIHATEQLRFRLRTDVQNRPAYVSWIEDTQHPGRQWSMDWAQPLSNVKHDYAIVARYFDPETEEQVVIAAGLGENGTTAAGEFLTDDHYVTQLEKFAPKGKWEKQNFEAVLETEVVGGRSGSPKVVAATFW